MMKKIMVLLGVLCVLPSLQARRMRDVFAEMPDSVLELLTRNNRLDCIDFIENNMTARVRNAMDDYSELKALNDTYLQLQLTAASRVEMKLLTVSDSVQYVCMVRTYAGPVEESTVAFYTADWQPLPASAHWREPHYDDFWVRSDTVSAEAWKEMKRRVDFRLVKASLSPDEEALELTLQLGTLEEKEKEAVLPFTRPLRYRWSAASRRFE